jgi:hypothetical protein
MRRIRKHRRLRPAHQIRSGALGRLEQAVEPAPTGKLVIVNHRDMRKPWKFFQSRLPAGIVGMAVAALMGEDHQTLQG